MIETRNNELLSEAMARAKEAIREASAAGMSDSNVATLCTASLACVPSSRSVVVEDINSYGPLFFANSVSGKGVQIASNHHVSLCFYLRSLSLQIIIDGRAGIVSDVEAESIWAKRDRQRQIVSWASNQSEPSRGKASHQLRMDKVRKSFGYEQIPLPMNWKGYRVSPARVEFWQANWRNPKDRQSYQLENDCWERVDLEP